MTRNSRRLPSHVLALALLAATSAAAEGLRIQVGDLSNPTAARDFNRDLERAAHRLCEWRYLPMELDKISACHTAIREEALAELSPVQREALAHSLGGAVDRLASTEH